LDLMAQFSEPFFEQILNLVNSKAVSVTKPVFYGLRPNMLASQKEIDRFEQFLSHLEQAE